MIAEIEADRPEFVVFVNVPMSFGRLTGSENADFFLRERVPGTVSTKRWERWI